ncbi:MAG: amidohydrolase family protein [Saprospiraceae bacterium]
MFRTRVGNHHGGLFISFWGSWSAHLILASMVFLPGLACSQAGQTTDPYARWQAFIANHNKDKFDYLIRGAQVVDGTGAVPYAADLLVQGSVIAFVGPVPEESGMNVHIIDAHGKYLTPGFIDAHAHGNPLKEDAFVNFLAMGVTTVCLGQDGTSPMYDDLREWFTQVEQVPQCINTAPMVGHGTLRVLSGIQYSNSPEPDALNRMIELLDDALNAGCFGLTTGLEYEPGGFADSLELIRLAKTVGKHHRLVMSHVRNEDDDALLASIDELAQMGKYVPVQVSHLKSVYGKGSGRAQEILSYLHQLRQSGIAITQDWYPYTASYTGLSILFPPWAKPPNDYPTVVRQRKSELLTFLHDKVLLRNGPAATLFGSGPYRGKTLDEAARQTGKSFEEILLELGPSGASAAYFIMDEDLQETLLLDSMTMICSDGSPDMFHPRGYGSFAKILGTYVRDRSLLTLAQAIRRMTGLPAGILRLPERGLIAPGYRADLVIFDLKEVMDNATFEQPHVLASGFDYVFVNGVLAWHDQQLIGHGGELLRAKNQPRIK